MPEMNEIRNYIIENESLPDTYLEVFERDPQTKKPIKTERRNLEVLITTSTLREGVNLRETSGIKNVAISFTDELHISQWVGRCRYNIENLIIAETYIRTDNYNQQSYLSQSRNNYKEFMKDMNHTKWFESVRHLIDHDITKIRRFVLSDREQLFTTYINQKWLEPSGLTGKDLDKYKIYKQEDKEEIIEKAIDCQLIDLPRSYITFHRIISFMEDTLGYIQHVPFEREFEMPLFYKGQQIGTRRVDFFVEGQVMVEIKAVIQLEDVHLAQAINYLEAYNREVGLLINFGSRSLDFKRVMNKKSNKMSEL
jgi:GxxExxY protein